MHTTLRKFGYPESLIAEWDHWCVLLRPQQATLGALIVVAKSDVTAFAALPPDAFVDLGRVTAAVEYGLQAFQPYSKINYLMLMMVDPHVHFHVVPRYDGERIFEGTTFKDPGWPGMPDLKFATDTALQTRMALQEKLRRSIAPPC
jgi:diadenosine tetraphosphate (Ap4A) HIT family hydrolase